jgi:hypothetical protein
MNKDPEILEGEVVESVSKNESRTHQDQPPPRFNIFMIPVFAKLRRNCLLSMISFLTLTVLAIYFHNGWLFLLAVLLPPWIFSKNK